jgi:hypothetical protein
LGVRRRAFLATGAAAFLDGAARADDFLADGRTARTVRFASPRASLQQCLAVLGKAAGTTLTAATELADEPLTGYVPYRPLRETMQALEELFDAAWSSAPANPAAYVLRLDPARHKPVAARHAAILKKQRLMVDTAAAEAARLVRSGTLPGDRSLQPTFALAIWARLTPPERDRVLQGTPVTITIPEAQADDLYRVMISISRREKTPLVGPLLATLDLDDLAEHGIPAIRVRATAIRSNGVTGAIGAIDFVPASTSHPTQPGEGPSLPMNIGEQGEVSGTREEVIFKLGKAADLPILSRHRALGGSAGVTAGGRKLAEVMADLASPNQLDAVYHATARGFHLFRSATEWIDHVALPPPGPVAAYLAGRPPMNSVVPFHKLLPLAQLMPVQLAILERGNTCSEDAHSAREVYALMHFYLALSPAQQAALFTPEGIPAAGCTHAQLHQLLAGKDKRAGWDVEGPLQNPKSIRLRFQEIAGDSGKNLEVEAVREGMVVASGNAQLPLVEAEDQPSAERR